MTDRAILEEKLRDESFVKELLTKETAEDAQAFFEANGIELTIDEVKAAGEILSKVASGEIAAEDIEKMANGELSEDELAEVAGGLIVTTGMIIAACVVGGIVGTGGTITAIHFRDEIIGWFRSW